MAIDVMSRFQWKGVREVAKQWALFRDTQTQCESFSTGAVTSSNHRHSHAIGQAPGPEELLLQ